MTTFFLQQEQPNRMILVGIRDWSFVFLRSIKNRMTEMVCDNTLTTTKKIAILKRSLSDDIRSGLGDSLSSPSLYHEAFAELESTYGHPKIISRVYIQSLMELPKVSNNDDKMPLKFSQTVTRSVSSLKNGGYENELKSSSILEFVLEKLPSELQSR